MKDLSDPRWIKLKGCLFLLMGLFSGALLLIEHFSLKATVLFVVAVWSFCRFYYFAFYVISRYVDPSFRFSGLWSFARYLLTHRGPTPNTAAEDNHGIQRSPSPARDAGK